MERDVLSWPNPPRQWPLWSSQRWLHGLLWLCCANCATGTSPYLLGEKAGTTLRAQQAERVAVVAPQSSSLQALAELTLQQHLPSTWKQIAYHKADLRWVEQERLRQLSGAVGDESMISFAEQLGANTLLLVRQTSTPPLSSQASASVKPNQASCTTTLKAIATETNQMLAAMDYRLTGDWQYECQREEPTCQAARKSKRLERQRAFADAESSFPSPDISNSDQLESCTIIEMECLCRYSAMGAMDHFLPKTPASPTTSTP